MSTLSKTLFAICMAFALVAAPARAEDTRPPVFGAVTSSNAKGKVTITAKITDETGVLQATCFWRKAGDAGYEKAPLISGPEDTFKATFTVPGGADAEYYLEAFDELGNGPASYGKANAPNTVSSGKKPAVASNEGGSRRKHGRRRKSQEEQIEQVDKPAESTDDVKGPPSIDFTPPASPAPEGEALTLDVKITGNKIAVAKAYFRKRGDTKFAEIPMTGGEDGAYKVEIPAEIAKGNIEYLLKAIDEKKQFTTLGDGAPTKPFSLAFARSAAAKPAVDNSVFTFAHKPVVSATPGQSLNIRAQATPPAEGGEPVWMRVLWRGSDGNDQETNLTADESGGVGGFAGKLAAPPGEGALYYQIVACNKNGKCGIDTGSKKVWHAVSVSNGEAKEPAAIDAVSSKAPAGLPD